MAKGLSAINPLFLDRAELLRACARKRFSDFVTFTKKDYEMNWHHKVICNKLQEFAEGKIKRLLIVMPPRHGKSELVSRRLPAFLFGMNPNLKIISASYSADLASMMNRDVQRIIDTSDYKELFPDVLLNSKNVRTVGTWLRNSDIFEIVGFNGVYRSSGVGGGITGMGADVLLIDDPIKNKDEAFSKVFRDKIYDWYASTAYTRLEKNGQVLLTLTRWHEDDLAGRLISLSETDKFADKFEIVHLPALKEGSENNDYDIRGKDDALWENKYNKDRLLSIKASIGDTLWKSLYQQNPTPDEGNIIKRAHIKTYKTLPHDLDEMIMSWDMAFKDKKESDYVVGQIWARKGAAYYLVHELRDRLDFSATRNAFIEYTKRFPRAYPRLVEDKANGPAIIDSLKSAIPGIIPINPKNDKYGRTRSVACFFEAGNVYYPDISIAPWVSEHIDEIVSFPFGKYDDRVDATTQALDYFGNRTVSTLDTMIL